MMTDLHDDGTTKNLAYDVPSPTWQEMAPGRALLGSWQAGRGESGGGLRKTAKSFRYAQRTTHSGVTSEAFWII